jgi:hypothetical protein
MPCPLYGARAHLLHADRELDLVIGNRHIGAKKLEARLRAVAAQLGAEGFTSAILAAAPFMISRMHENVFLTILTFTELPMSPEEFQAAVDKMGGNVSASRYLSISPKAIHNYLLGEHPIPPRIVVETRCILQAKKLPKLIRHRIVNRVTDEPDE